MNDTQITITWSIDDVLSVLANEHCTTQCYESFGGQKCDTYCTEY